MRHDAPTDEIKRRWRELAREHHPDRAAHDRAERERLTTRMARINAAYDVLRDPVRRARYDASPQAWRRRDAERRTAGQGDRETLGPPPPPPTTPVTARYDTSALFRGRAATTVHRRAVIRTSQPPLDRHMRRHERDLRASAPNGPVQRSVVPGHAAVPSLAEARATTLGFGRFHGLTLGEVAEREPTYIDWIAATITRDRDLVQCARVVASDLDARGVERRTRVAAT